MKTLNDLRSLKRIISSVNGDTRPRYNSMLFTGQVKEVSQKLIENQPQVFWMTNIHNRVETRAALTEIIVRMYTESCGSQEYS